MRVLHLAAGNRWTGPAAPAFAEVEALRDAGVDAHFAYVGGYKLEAKIGRRDFVHAIIEKSQNPLAFRRSVRAIRELVERHAFDGIHAHLTYDHWLARFAVGDRAFLARTFHSERALRRDPLTRLLMRATDAVFIINDSFRRSAALRDEHPIYTPPPVDRRQFRPDGPNLRAAYGLDAASPVIVAIGKLSPDRGFETVLQSFARFREHRHDARLMIIGHGEHRPSLEAVASGLGISPHVIWAGYHEDDLAEHYRAADLLFFTAPGSDAGHRAVLEAMACGVVPISAPLPGISSLLRGLDSLVASDASAEAVAARAEAIWSGGVGTVRDRLQQQAGQFAYSRAAERLKTAYATVM